MRIVKVTYLGAGDILLISPEPADSPRALYRATRRESGVALERTVGEHFELALYIDETAKALADERGCVLLHHENIEEAVRTLGVK